MRRHISQVRDLADELISERRVEPNLSEIVFDASALLALLNREPGHEEVARTIPQAVVSTVNLPRW